MGKPLKYDILQLEDHSPKGRQAEGFLRPCVSLYNVQTGIDLTAMAAASN